MSQQGERRPDREDDRSGRKDDWWGELYDDGAEDAGPARTGDTLDDRFASAYTTVVEPTPHPHQGPQATAEPGPEQQPRTGRQDPYAGRDTPDAGQDDPYAGQDDPYAGRKDARTGQDDAYTGQDGPDAGQGNAYTGSGGPHGPGNPHIPEPPRLPEPPQVPEPPSFQAPPLPTPSFTPDDSVLGRGDGPAVSFEAPPYEPPAYEPPPFEPPEYEPPAYDPTTSSASAAVSPLPFAEPGAPGADTHAPDEPVADSRDRDTSLPHTPAPDGSAPDTPGTDTSAPDAPDADGSAPDAPDPGAPLPDIPDPADTLWEPPAKPWEPPQPRPDPSRSTSSAPYRQPTSDLGRPAGADPWGSPAPTTGPPGPPTPTAGPPAPTAEPWSAPTPAAGRPAAEPDRPPQDAAPPEPPAPAPAQDPGPSGGRDRGAVQGGGGTAAGGFRVPRPVRHVGDRPPTYDAEPTALPTANPEDLAGLVPDTALDGARYGSCTLRAASVRGDSARYRGEPRRDSLLTARFGTGRQALVLVAVATGARASAEAHRSAAEACQEIGRFVGRHHVSLAEDMGAGRRGSLKAGLHRLTDRCLGRLRSRAEELGVGPEEYAASLRCLLLPADPHCRTRIFFGVGPGGLFRIRGGAWQDIEPHSPQDPGTPQDPRNPHDPRALHDPSASGHPSVPGSRGPGPGQSPYPVPGQDPHPAPGQSPDPTERLTAALGIPLSARRNEQQEPARGAFLFHAAVAAPGDVLLMCSAGLAEAVRGEAALAAYLTDRWARGGPPGLTDFLADTQVRVKGYADDRTAAGVWEA